MVERASPATSSSVPAMSQSRHHLVRAVGTRLFLLGVLLMSTVTLPAQHQLGTPDGPVFRASTDLVTIDAVVMDRDGKPVTNLTREDFEVTVAGKHQTLEQAVYIRTQEQPQALAAVRAAAIPRGGNVPAEPRSESAASQALRSTGTTPDKVARTIALVVDDLGLSFDSTFYVRKAIHKYIDTQIEPGDLVAIVRTAGGVGALQQFTTDKRLLHLAADRLRWDFRSRQGVGAFAASKRERAEPDSSSTISTICMTRCPRWDRLAALEFIARGVVAAAGAQVHRVLLRRVRIALRGSDGQRTTAERRGSERIWKAMARHALARERRRRGDLHDRCARPADGRADGRRQSHHSRLGFRGRRR